MAAVLDSSAEVDDTNAAPKRLDGHVMLWQTITLGSASRAMRWALALLSRVWRILAIDIQCEMVSGSCDSSLSALSGCVHFGKGKTAICRDSWRWYVYEGLVRLRGEIQNVFDSNLPQISSYLHSSSVRKLACGRL